MNTEAAPAHLGQIVQIYATGVNLPPSVYLGFSPAEVIYSGPSGQFPGLWQVNARIPSEPAVGHGQVPVFLISGGAVSNAVTLSIE